MTTIYEYADVLRMIADKKEIQKLNSDGWKDVLPFEALELMLNGVYRPLEFRAKPATVIINGIECPERFGQPTDHTVTVTWRSEREHKGRTLEFYYSDKMGAEATFNALVRPLGAVTE